MVLHATGGVGVDAVLITAGTSSNGPVEQAAKLCRDRGRVVVVGAVGMDLPRPPFFEKELTFRVSRSYGPGRYDPTYEEGGIDYPVGYVRWTENRNMGAFLELVRSGDIALDPLISHRVDIADGPSAYDLLSPGDDLVLGVLLEYGDAAEPTPAARPVQLPTSAVGDRAVGVGVIGAGNFALSTLLPAMKGVSDLALTGAASARGHSAHHMATKFGFRFASATPEDILADDATDIVAILTRHDLHSEQIVAALNAGKHVFCEKPPALNENELTQVVQALSRSRAADGPALVTVGYNRRFAPMAVNLRRHFAEVNEPLLVQIRVNAGFIPVDHWVHDPSVGGGRLIGELCHFVDLAGYFTQSIPVRVSALALPDGGRYREDNVVVNLTMANGSIASISYVSAGHRRMGKERFEVFGGQRAATLDNFRELRCFGGQGGSMKSRLAQDKGHRAEWQALVTAVRTGAKGPIPTASWIGTSLATFAAVRSLRSGAQEVIDVNRFVAEATKGAGTT